MLHLHFDKLFLSPFISGVIHVLQNAASLTTEFLEPFLTKRLARFSKIAFGKSIYLHQFFSGISLKKHSDILNFLCAHDYFHLVRYQGDLGYMFLQFG